MRRDTHINSRVAGTVVIAISALASTAFPYTSLSMEVSEDPSSPETLAEMAWDKSSAGQQLDLDGFNLTFADDFDGVSITTDLGPGPWFAPVHGPFGGAAFRPPSPEGPFFIKDGLLTIR